MSSLAGSLASAMGNAMHGAMLGEAIGRANQEADEAHNRADAASRQAAAASLEAKRWRLYAQSLQEQIDSVEISFQDMNKIAAKGEVQIEQQALRIKQLTEQLDQVTKKLNYNNELSALEIEDNVKYGKGIKYRLRQIEKALQHSSADKLAMMTLLEPYKAIVERFNLQGHLPADLKEKADAVRKSFMEGKSLVDDPNLAALIEQAPMPKPEGFVKF